MSCKTFGYYVVFGICFIFSEAEVIPVLVAFYIKRDLFLFAAAFVRHLSYIIECLGYPDSAFTRKYIKVPCVIIKNCNAEA